MISEERSVVLTRHILVRLWRAGWPWLLVMILAVPAWRPLLAEPGLPNGSDTLYHVYRTAEMARSWEAGVFFPRWASAFYFGYGSPVFSYYAPLTYYFGAALMQGMGQTALSAMRILIALCALVMVTGMMGLGRRLVSPLGGILAALIYLYAPYMVYTEPYARGVVPELLAFALWPWVMWAFVRLRTPAGGRLVAAALALALLILAHNLMGLILTALLAAWCLWEAVATGLAGGWRASLASASARTLAGLLGLGASAWFWLPAIAETNAVNLANITGLPELDFRNFFVPLPDLLAWPRRLDGGAINGLLYHLTIGPAALVAGVAGMATVVVGIALAVRAGRRDDPILRQGVFFGLAGLFCLILIIPAARPLWEALSPLALLQFPWRWLGPAAFCLALLGAMNALWLAHLPLRLRPVAVAMAVAGIIGPALPTLYVPEWIHRTVDASLDGYMAAELSGDQRATTYTDEYRPLSVFTPPDPVPGMVADLRAGGPVDRANVPDGVQASLLSTGPQAHAWRVTSAEPFTMEVYLYNWPGWTARIDGAPAVITSSPEHGLITFPVPAGDHRIDLTLESTPPRTIGLALAVISLLGCLGAVRLWRAAPVAGEDAPVVSPPGLSRGLWAGAVLVGGLAFIIWRPGVGWLASEPGTAPVDVALSARLADHIRLLGYSGLSATYAPGDTLDLDLYWYAEAPIAVDYNAFVHIARGGPPLAQADKQHPGGRQISRWWTPEGYIYDGYRIALPHDMPPGTYEVLVGLYTCAFRPPGECGNGDRAPVVRAGQPAGDAILLGTIEVR